MVYNALVKKCVIGCDEGTVLLELDEKELLCYYIAPDEFAEKYLIPGHIIPVDIWIGLAAVVELRKNSTPFAPFDKNTTEGMYGGRVDAVLGDRAIRLDCDKYMFHVKFDESDTKFAELQMQPPLEGKNLLVYGSRQVLFPGTEWCYENIGCV